MQERFVNHYVSRLSSYCKPTKGTITNLNRYLTGANLDMLKLASFNKLYIII